MEGNAEEVRGLMLMQVGGFLFWGRMMFDDWNGRREGEKVRKRECVEVEGAAVGCEGDPRQKGHVRVHGNVHLRVGPRNPSSLDTCVLEMFFSYAGNVNYNVYYS